MKKLLVLMTLYTSIAQAGFISSTVKTLTAPIFSISDAIVRNTPDCHPVIPFAAAALTLRSPLGRMACEIVKKNPTATTIGLLACMYSLKDRRHNLPIKVQVVTFGDKSERVHKVSGNHLIVSAGLSLAASAVIAPIIYTAGKAGFNALFNYCRPS